MVSLLLSQDCGMEWLTKNKIFKRTIWMAGLPTGTMGAADGGTRRQNCTCHFNPCKISGISSTRIIWKYLALVKVSSLDMRTVLTWIKSFNTCDGTFNILANPHKAFGLYGGADTRDSKNFSMICKSSMLHWYGGLPSGTLGGTWVTFKCRDCMCVGSKNTWHWRQSTLNRTTPGSVAGIACNCSNKWNLLSEQFDWKWSWSLRIPRMK